MITSLHKVNDPKINRNLLTPLIDLIVNIDSNSSKKDFKSEIKKFLLDNNFDIPGRNYFLSSKQIYSINEKEGVAVCVQTGHFGMMFYDLFKLEYLFKKEFIDNAIIICPTLYTKFYQNNVTTFEKIIEETEDFKDQINVPILTIGVE